MQAPAACPVSQSSPEGQLYDLEDDPGETKNLYETHPELVKELQTMLNLSIATGRSAPLRTSQQAKHPAAAIKSLLESEGSR